VIGSCARQGHQPQRVAAVDEELGARLERCTDAGAGSLERLRVPPIQGADANGKGEIERRLVAR
jgi:hypothetical protein